MGSVSTLAFLGLLVASAGEPSCGTPEGGLRFGAELVERLRCEQGADGDAPGCPRARICAEQA